MSGCNSNWIGIQPTSIDHLGKKILTEEQVAQRKRFERWCTAMGYFPHTKYLEAWNAALSWKEDE
jgi:hypothetical protein